MSVEVALIGAGIMGSAIGTRLLERGHKLHVFDLDAGKVDALAKKGAVATTSIADAVRNCSFVILSLNSAKIVRSAVFGDDGLASVGRPECLLIDMSSIDPGETREMAGQLKERCGMAWLDCPLSGGVPGALTGKLTVMAGGAQEILNARDSKCFPL
jgi:2-hydroxy-3-oxopropionate reductase